MTPTVYIETSVLSYLAARPSRDVVIAAYQQVTREWWAGARDRFELDYLITWNFRHIANAAMRSRIERACRRAGYQPAIICTPNELMEPDHADATD